MMKTCSNCLTEKPLNDFAIRNHAKGTFQTHCKACHTAYSKIHYQQNKKKYMKKAREFDARRADLIFQLKIAKGCSYCLEKDPICLDFHHKDKTTKDFNIGNKFGDVSLETLMREIDKCEIVCSNCHRKIHGGRTLSTQDRT